MHDLHHDSIEIPTLIEGKGGLPCYTTAGAAGADIKAHLKEPLLIPEGESALIPTGLSMDIPEGYEIQIRPRSSLALKYQVTVLNTPGTIDADYRGEIKVILINHGKKPFLVIPEMRIAQLVLASVCRGHFVVASELSQTARGTGGFGHTGLGL